VAQFSLSHPDAALVGHQASARVAIGIARDFLYEAIRRCRGSSTTTPLSARIRPPGERRELLANPGFDVKGERK